MEYERDISRAGLYVVMKGKALYLQEMDPWLYCLQPVT
jgi:hypothetical protein